MRRQVTVLSVMLLPNTAGASGACAVGEIQASLKKTRWIGEKHDLKPIKMNGNSPLGIGVVFLDLVHDSLGLRLSLLLCVKTTWSANHFRT